jgi:uncharacterized membrane protein
MCNSLFGMSLSEFLVLYSSIYTPSFIKHGDGLDCCALRFHKKKKKKKKKKKDYLSTCIMNIKESKDGGL